MAQTIAEIKKGMTDAFIENTVIATLYGLTGGLSFEEQFSAVSLESILFDIFSGCVWSMQKLFDLHRIEVLALIANEKAHRAKWYATMALRFRYGYNLVPDEDYYDNTGLTAATIAAAQIVKYAAAIEVTKGMRIKAAKLSGGDLAALSGLELTAFTTYMNRVKDAGVRLYIGSAGPDSLKLHLVIYYNALVLDGAGARLDGGGLTPVKDAVDDFLKNQPFNGLFVVARLIDALQGVVGVVIPHVISAEARYGALPYVSKPVEYLPDAGYLRIISPTDLVIDYIPHEPI